VNLQLFYKKGIAALFLTLFAFAGALMAQVTRPTPTTLVVEASRPTAVAGSNNLYCAGYVQTAPVNVDNKIVGGENEQEQFVYSQGQNLYISMGANKGVQVGDMFTVIRPRGKVRTRWTSKGSLGFYVQEVGALEVIRVKNEVSAVRVKTSCETILTGDLVQPVQVRTSPLFTNRPALDLFGDPSGKASGKIFMARDDQEMLGREQIVYIDLGADDNVQVGDYLTIFRPLGKGNLYREDRDEIMQSRDVGFESSRNGGGRYSNQAPRVSGTDGDGQVVRKRDEEADRPKNIRKVVGEAVILNVKEHTATAVITRTRQEIHTGDMVEVQ
jgi:hypothetical protein